MKHLTVRVSDSLFEKLGFLMEKWEATRSEALRLAIIYQYFAEQGNQLTGSEYMRAVRDIVEAHE